MTPLPEDTCPTDPKWAVAYLELANGLVIAGAKARIISRFTGINQSQIREMYRGLRGTDPPSGPIALGHARFFATPSKYTSEAWSIQCAIFLGCFERVAKISAQRLHLGWHMLAAFQAYRKLTEKLYQETSVKRLDINQAFALLTHSGFLRNSSTAQLQRRVCPSCQLRYPIVVSDQVATQRCPACAINVNHERLASQASPANNARRRKIRK